VAAPPVPTHFEMTTADAKVEMVLPDGFDRYPELHKAMYESGRDELTEFAKVAEGDRARYRAKGRPLNGLYARRVTWTITAVSPHLISLKSVWFTDTGGAHPNHGTGAFLWDRVRNQMVLKSELFKADYDFSGLDRRLCAEITRVKSERMGPTDSRSWTCPKWRDSRAVLIPSNRPYRIGGLMFLFDPYVIGPYAEGDYQAVIPLPDFQAALNPEWAGDFVGWPAVVQAKPAAAKAPIKAG
jgi:hypothetical protein